MCTAITYKTEDFYFGRTLDYDYSYPQTVTVTPRNYPFNFRQKGTIYNHYAIIGMAYITDNYPLYFDAVNEKGLAVAGLNFVGNAHYRNFLENKDNIAQFEFIPWILSQCSTVKETKSLLANINITNLAFNENFPVAQLHWIIADKSGSITVESVKDGLKIYDNPLGVLTNNPPFDQQMLKLTDYMQLSPEPPENSFAKKLSLKPYSRGLGAFGLPGDLSSSSRFIRASFIKSNSLSESTETQSVNQFFHILGAVEQQRGCCKTENGMYEITQYTSCCNADKGIYYYTTYENHCISAVNMHKVNLESNQLSSFSLITEEQITMQN